MGITKEELERETYKMIKGIINDIDSDSKEIRLKLGVTDYDAPYLLHYDVSLHLPESNLYDAKDEIFDFLSRIDMLATVDILEQKKK